MTNNQIKDEKHRTFVAVTKIKDQLKCERCWKHTPEVGKIKVFHEVCLRCAGDIKYLIDNNIDPSGKYKDWELWLNRVSNRSLIENIPTTHKIGGFELVYMSEEVFKVIYHDKLLSEDGKRKLC